MPPSDYKHVAEAVPAAPFVWMRLRALWSRIRHRGPNTVAGHRLL